MNKVFKTSLDVLVSKYFQNTIFAEPNHANVHWLIFQFASFWIFIPHQDTMLLY